MSILKAVWNRLGDSSLYRGSGFQSILPLCGSPYASRYILDYNSRIVTLGLHGPPTLSLAGRSLIFVEGRWEDSNPGGSVKLSPRLQQLKERMQALEEENRLLRLRQEVLMDLLTEAVAQVDGLRQERKPKKVTLVTP